MKPLETAMLEIPVRLDYEGLLRNLRREGTPSRVFSMELFLDDEIQQELALRFGTSSQDPNDPYYQQKTMISLYRYLGYELIRVGLDGMKFPRQNTIQSQDSAILAHKGGRGWVDSTKGPIATWEDFENYPWPDPAQFDTRLIEWYSANLPDDMCLGGGCHNVFEQAMWLMGYEPLCYALHDQPDLVYAIFDRVGSIYLAAAKVYAQFERVKVLFDGDDMGFRSGTLIPPWILKEKTLPWHKRMVEVCHSNDMLYLLHSCGNLEKIMPVLIDDVNIDAKHSFEDAIEGVMTAKRRWGDRIALIGGIDVDFLAQTTPEEVRHRVRETLEVCLPGGGYCLGTGNSVTNYIPLQNYLVMLDEGRRYA